MLTLLKDWAGGQTDYTKAPYTMYLRKATVTDYSTGTSYKYNDNSGSSGSITAEGGQVEANKGEAPKSVESAPPVTATVQEPTIPWGGTHKETSSFVTPNEWPWTPRTMISTTARSTSVPPGFTSGSVRPSATSSMSEHPLIFFNLLPYLLTLIFFLSVPLAAGLTCFFIGLTFPFWL